MANDVIVVVVPITYLTVSYLNLAVNFWRKLKSPHHLKSDISDTTPTPSVMNMSSSVIVQVNACVQTDMRVHDVITGDFNSAAATITNVTMAAKKKKLSKVTVVKVW
jgi:hypothetical protein